MKRKCLAVLLCTMVLGTGLAGCGNTENTAEGSTAVESESTEEPTEEPAEEEETGGFVKEIELLYNDADELNEYVPVAVLGSSQAETMMQVTGYTYTVNPIDDTNYELTVEFECGTPGEDTTLYMKRTFTYTGTYTEEGDVYTLNAAEHMTMTQETAGQFAAESGEGGADYWGPDGLSIDETFANDEGYAGLHTGADYLALMTGCTMTVDGSEIVSFAPLS